jgi:hypothetical protein
MGNLTMLIYRRDGWLGEMEAVVISTGVHTFVGKAAHLVDSTEVVGHFQEEGNQQSPSFANRWC